MDIKKVRHDFINQCIRLEALQNIILDEMEEKKLVCLSEISKDLMADYKDSLNEQRKLVDSF